MLSSSEVHKAHAGMEALLRADIRKLERENHVAAMKINSLEQRIVTLLALRNT